MRYSDPTFPALLVFLTLVFVQAPLKSFAQENTGLPEPVEQVNNDQAEAKNLQAQSWAHLEQKDYPKALETGQMALDLAERSFKDTDTEYHVIIFHMGMIHQAKADYDTANTYFDRIIDMTAAAYGRDHIDMVSAMNEKARNFLIRNMYQEAQDILDRAKGIFELEQQKDFMAVEFSIMMSPVEMFNQCIKGKEHLIEESNDADRKEFTKCLLKKMVYLPGMEEELAREVKFMIHYAQVLHRLVVLSRARRQYADAEQYCLKGIGIREFVLGHDHEYVLFLLKDLAEIYRLQSKKEDALSAYEKLLRLKEGKHGPKSLKLIPILEAMASVHHNLDHSREAEEYKQRVKGLRSGR